MAGDLPAAWLEVGGLALWGRLYGKDHPPGFSARLWEDTTEEVRERFRNHVLAVLAAVAPLIRAAECATLRARVEALTAALRINGLRQGATHAQIDDWMVMINIAALKGAKP